MTKLKKTRDQNIYKENFRKGTEEFQIFIGTFGGFLGMDPSKGIYHHKVECIITGERKDKMRSHIPPCRTKQTMKKVRERMVCIHN